MFDKLKKIKMEIFYTMQSSTLLDLWKILLSFDNYYHRDL